MRILAKSTVNNYGTDYPKAKDALDAWYLAVKQAEWATPQEVKETFGHASIIGDNRVVFNIKGNDYRLVCYCDYDSRIVYIKWFGTHAEYDKIDAEKEGQPG